MRLLTLGGIREMILVYDVLMQITLHWYGTHHVNDGDYSFYQIVLASRLVALQVSVINLSL